MPKFSIIIPIYNTANYLDDCISSVIKQTFKDIEIILINDGSQDNADEICLNYQARDKRIKYYQQANQGVSIARNLGIQKSNGEYLFFLDSDDKIEAKFLEKNYKILKQNKYDFLIAEKRYKNVPIQDIGALPILGFIVARELLNNYPDICFPEKLQPCEDGIFSNKCLAVATNVGKCNNANYYYRNIKNSNSHTIDNDKIFNAIPFWLNILEEFYKKYNLLTIKKQVLLAFIENEPFNLRFNVLPFSEEQKESLFNTIHDFIIKNELKSAINSIKGNPKFKIFINSNSYKEYIEKVNFIKKTFYKNILERIISLKEDMLSQHKILTIIGIKVRF